MFRSIKKRLSNRNESGGSTTSGGGYSSSGELGHHHQQSGEYDDDVEALPRVRAATASSTASSGQASSSSSAPFRTSTTLKSSSSAGNSSRGGGSGGGAGRMMAAALHKAKQSAANHTMLHSSSKSSRIVLVDEPRPLDPPSNPLFKFDTCVDAADALTASSGHDASTILPSQRVDDNTGLSDCSVLVSPEGDLLLIPGDPRQVFQPTHEESVGKSTKDTDECNAGAERGGRTPASSSSSLFSELMLHAKDDYASSMFVGADLYSDKSLNRFSSKGWSITATSTAVQQTNHTLQKTVELCDHFVQYQTECASKTVEAVDKYRMQLTRIHQMATSMPYGPILDPQRPENSLEPPPPSGGRGVVVPTSIVNTIPTRVGPILFDSGTIHSALEGVTQYYATSAHQELVRWRTATGGATDVSKVSSSSNCPIATLRDAAQTFHRRLQQRQLGLDAAASRVQQMEQRLRGLQQIALAKWDAVFAAEDLVTHKVELALQERSRERERQKLEQWRSTSQGSNNSNHNNLTSNHSDFNTGGVGPLGATSEEIWSIVSTVAESMEDGSFEPIDMPEVPLSVPKDRSMDDLDSTKAITAAAGTSTTTTTSTLSTNQVGSVDDNDSNLANSSNGPSSTRSSSSTSLPPVSRETIELEVGLPELRAAALAADEDVADGADSLMNLLTTLDTSRRSARIAADTALVSACNAQATCLRSLLHLERKLLEQRLKQLEVAEALVERIDVRNDLDRFINVDKNSRGGTSHLGDDDDGGIAAALAILSRHVDGSMGSDPLHRMTVETATSEDDGISSEMLTEALDKVFQKGNPLLASSAESNSDDVAQERGSFEETISFLCTSVSKIGPTARARRSTVCYLLNSKRSSQAEIPSPLQFRALCRLFSAILTGCSAEEGGVANAKMCIMLSQTFYVTKRDKDDGLDLSESSENGNDNDSTRERRVYVKSYLKSHPIWNKDDFWDHALSNQITESLTHSGVMSNFEKGPVSNNSMERKKSEWTETRKMKWYDLNALERTEAASQVQAVVFAQLGALAHSMIELGCGLQRSCAFVRRMAVRHQLPNSQRTMLLQHLMKRDDVEKQELFEASAASI